VLLLQTVKIIVQQKSIVDKWMKCEDTGEGALASMVLLPRCSASAHRAAKFLACIGCTTKEAGSTHHAVRGVQMHSIAQLGASGI